MRENGKHLGRNNKDHMKGGGAGAGNRLRRTELTTANRQVTEKLKHPKSLKNKRNHKSNTSINKLKELLDKKQKNTDPDRHVQSAELGIPQIMVLYSI